jgi:hypothetical protein
MNTRMAVNGPHILVALGAALSLLERVRNQPPRREARP